MLEGDLTIETENTPTELPPTPKRGWEVLCTQKQTDTHTHPNTKEPWQALRHPYPLS